MTYSYADRHIWIDDLVKFPAQPGGYPLCADHGDRFTPPLGWTLTDLRSLSRLFAPLEVA
jgi:hypothetical protein